MRFSGINKNGRACSKKSVKTLMEIFCKIAILTEKTMNFDVTSSVILSTGHSIKDFSIDGVFFLFAFDVVLEQLQKPREKDVLIEKSLPNMD